MSFRDERVAPTSGLLQDLYRGAVEDDVDRRRAT
jgi:hypothetical protein